MAIIVILHKEKEWFEKGDKALVAKKYDEAIDCYKKAIEINPDYAKAHFNLGVAYYKKKMEYVGADYLYQAGLLFLKQGDREGALKAYEVLKLTKTKELQIAIYKKLYPEVK